MLLCAVLLAAGGLVGLLTVRRPPERTTEPSAPPEDDRVPVERCAHCGVAGPQLHPPQAH